MIQFRESANIEIAYWDNTLHAWYHSRYSQKEQEITIQLNSDIIPALDSLAQELFSRKVYPLFQIRGVRDGFFPLSHYETEYFSARFEELEGRASGKKAEEILKEIEKESSRIYEHVSPR
ncbi:MAG: hypothetical protein KKB21_01145 [Nanoarchaeota archaeon]|nr:hypothetical protein [Nanoarchaeota archaeon]